MSVSKQQAIELSKEIERFTKELFASHGLDVPKMSTRYGDQYKVTITTGSVELDESGINLASQEAVDFVRYAEMGLIDLPAEALGRTFRNPDGVEYVLAGYVPSRPKYPYVAKRVADGKSYKFTDHVVRLIRSQEVGA